MHVRRTLARLGAAAGAAGLLTLAVAAPASAHVTVTASDTAAGAYTVLTFSVPHGCDGSATTRITIQMPEEVVSVTPTRNAYYGVEKKMAKLDEPIEDAHGNSITERVGQVVYTSKLPLPEGYRDTMELSLQLPDAPGTTLAFPVIQKCEKGQTGWTELAADGQDADELEHPAPVVTVTEAGGSAESATTVPETADDDSDGNGLAIAGLVVGALGVAVGGVALSRTRGRA